MSSAHFKTLDYWKERFKCHKATLCAPPDEGWIRWGKPGTNIDCIHYSTFGQSLLVCGDLGDAVYEWSRRITLEWVAGCNIHYVASKCQASEAGRGFRDYDPEVAVALLKEVFADHEHLYGCHAPSEQLEAQKQALKAASDSEYEWHQFLGDDGDAEKALGSDWWEHGNIGDSICVRAYAHLFGLKCMFGIDK